MLTLLGPDSKTLACHLSVSHRLVVNLGQQAALADNLGRSKSSHGSSTRPLAQSPSSNTPPRLSRIGAEEAGRELSKNPFVLKKTRQETQSGPRPFRQSFRWTGPALILGGSVPRTPTHADPGRTAWQWPVESSRRLTQEPLRWSCCFHHLTPFPLNLLIHE